MQRRSSNSWQVFALLLVLVTLACNASLPTIPTAPTASPTPVPLTPTPTATPVPLPPTIVETQPPIGSAIPLQAPLTVYFSEKMDPASVEAALTSDFSGGFTFSWLDNSTLSLTPKSALPSNGQITFTLAVTAKSTAGLALLEPLTFSYQTAGALRVTQVLPSTEVAEVSPDSAVVVAFNQPVVPLGADAASLPAGLTLEPAAQGQGEWLNTSTYIFHPDPALSGGVDYTARINPQLTAVSGAALDPADPQLAWQFKTSLPKLLNIAPSSETGLLVLDPAFELTFNQPMDQAAVEAGFALGGPDGRVAGKFEWNEKATSFKFTPSALLARDAQYMLSLSGLVNSRGGATLGHDVGISYSTVPQFGIWQNSFPNGQIRPRDRGVTITFTSPLADYKDSEWSSLITVEPQPGYFNPSFSQQAANIYGGFSPGQLYTLTFSADLKDKWGQALGQPYVFTFREPDADPALSYASYADTLFVRPDQPVVDVQAVNLYMLNLRRAALTLDEYLSYDTDYNKRQAYTPQNPKTWSLTPNLPRNDNQPVSISISDASLATGLYSLNIDSPNIQYHNNTDRMVVASNINVTMKNSADEALVWAMDWRTNAPVANVPVRLFDQTLQEIASGQTDANGLWRGKLAQTEEYRRIAYAVLGQPGDDQFGLAASNWNQGITPMDFDLNANFEGPHPTVYTYTERPVYRPGDTVHYRGLLRDIYNGRYTEAGFETLTVALNDPNGKIAEQKVAISAYGTFNSDFALPANATPGDYYFYVQDAANNPVDNGYLYFQVADYRKPEINLSAAISPDPALSGTALTGQVTAEYFFGAPVPDLPFEWRLYGSKSYFPLANYQTGVYRSRWLSGATGLFGSTYRSGKGITGADGKFSIPLAGLEVEDPTDLTLEITASESGGFPVSARATVTLHPASFYIGIRPEMWVGQAGAPLAYSLVTADWNQKPVSKTLTVTFEKVRWERSGEAYGYIFTPVYTPLETQTVTTAADGTAKVTFTPPEAGTYMLDVSGEGAHSQELTWVGGAENAVWPNLPFQQLKLTANQDKYQPGEIAQVFIPNPFNTPAPALITVERGTFLDAEIITLPAGGYTYSLTLTDEHAPNVYLSATLLGADNDFRLGYVDLPVDPGAFVLNVDLKATPEKAKPGDQLTLDLTVTDSRGQPVQGEFSMAVVDLAALALAEPNSEDIVPAYYDIQPLGVRTGLTAAIYNKRFFNASGGMGGGGGGEVLTLREKFPDTAYWKADIITDAQGKAQITLILPDNLTTWQVDSRGLTQDTKVGQARVQVKTSKELLIRPQTPRFLVAGDHATLAAMVNNTTDQPLDATVSLTAGGFSLDDPTQGEQKVSVPANGRVRVAWMGTVQAGEAVEAIFAVKSSDPSTGSGQGFQDASRPTDGPIPVLRYSAPQTFSTAGILTDASTRQEIIALPRTFQPLGGSLTLELAPSLASVILGSLSARSLPDEDWSTEGIVSDFLPNLVTYQTLRDAGVPNPAATDALKASIPESVRRLLAAQNQADGGWPWGIGGSKSDAYLTAYAVFGLQQFTASDLVASVDIASNMERARTYLADVLPELSAKNERWSLNQAVFIAYTLQQSGGVDRTFLGQFYDSRDQLDPWAQALLAETLLSIAPDDSAARELLSALQTSAIRSATGAHWESLSGDWHVPGSPLFTTAIVMEALSRHDPATPLLADAARYLTTQRSATGWWGSAYETAWVIMALDRYMQSTGELRGDFAFSATLNGAPLAEGQASAPQNLTTVTANAPLTQLNLGGANALNISRQAGNGKLYYRAALSVDRPVEAAPALERGMSIRREFLACPEKTCAPITSYQMPADTSGRITVRLTITVPNDSYYFLAQDYIPAGADILDSSLKTSQQAIEATSIEQEYDASDPFSNGWGWWYFNKPQIYKDHILWNADYLPAGTYVLTYTLIPSLPGEYRVLPAHAWQAYFPEVQGTSAGAVFTIGQ